MRLGINGKSALVTGGAHGIGKAIVSALRAEGVYVVYTSREYQKDRDCIKHDLEDIKDLTDKVMWTLEERHPDILVNNAGSTFSMQDPYASIEEYRKVMRLNFEIPVELSTALIPSMKQRKWGRIVNITSCSGMENRGPVAFCSAKAALTAYTRSMGRVLAIEESGIVMSAVYPGVVYTEGGHWEKILKERPEHWENYKKEIPVSRFGQPEEIAAQVVFLCSELAGFHHGSIIGVDGGLSKGFAHHL